MDEEMEQMRAEIADAVQVARGGGHWYGKRLQERVIGYAQRVREQGESYERIAQRIGIPLTTLYVWLRGPKELPAVKAGEFRPVTVDEQGAACDGVNARGVALVTPAGYRIEGLGIEDLKQLLRELR